MKEEMIDLQLLWIFAHRRMDICDCRVAFETENFLASKGRFAVAHQDSWVGSEGTEDMFGDKDESLDNSCLTLSTRFDGEYMSHIQDGMGDVT